MSEPLVDTNVSENTTKNAAKDAMHNKKSLNDNGDDFVSMGGSFLSKLNWKVAIFIFFIGMLIFSDIFLSVISSIPGAVQGEEATTRGTLIQLLTLSISYLLIDVLVQTKYI